MIPLFRPGETVLDLGCGTGEDAECLDLFGVSVRDLDASPEMVRIARDRSVNAEVLILATLAGHQTRKLAG
jgi:ubiquinone/menaquinone biosynthesis C-methylase UbiE